MNQDVVFQKIFESLQRSFPKKQLLSTADYAAIFDTKIGTIYNKISSGTVEVKPVRAGGKPRWRVVDIAMYLAEMEGE